MAQLGFVGLGKMGGRVAKRLLDAGHTVTGYNRTRSKAQWLLDAGMQWGESPRQVAESVALSNELLTAARAMGMASEDFAVMFEVLARMSGVA
jgi:3-hydroxyisobutyrate dehydrogenase-like beta-hydroxyacid dehydrogenase